MYLVKPARSGALPIFGGSSFNAAVKWCLKAQKAGDLTNGRYEIHGSDSRWNKPELVATFEIDAGDTVISDYADSA